MGRDFYQILGVPRDADQKTIKKAYREGAMRWHPDKNPTNQEEAKRKFQDIADAYQCLSDPDKRAAYDRYGEDAINGAGSGSSGFGHFMSPDDLFSAFFSDGFGFPGSGFSHHPGGFTQHFFFGGPGGSHFSSGFGDDFDDDFMFSSRSRRRAELEKPPAIELNTPCTLEQLHNGCTKKLLVTRQIQGENQQVELNVVIEPGTKEGKRIVMEGVGNKNAQGPQGDVVFIIKERNHKIFKREGDNLVMTERIALKTALCGYTLNVKGIDEEMIEYPIEGVIKPGDRITLPGKGMNKANGMGRGNLIVNFDIVFPNKLPEDTIDIFNELLPDLGEE